VTNGSSPSLDTESDGEQALPEGHIVGGRFRIGHRLGAGAMGTVYAATHLELGQTVALKFLRDDRDRSAVKRFLREAKAAAQLTNPHVTRVIDVCRLDSGAPFIVMEYLDGETLSTLIGRGVRLPYQEVALYTLQICEALGDAHAHGIVHRDLKPANLMLTRGPAGPMVKVLDFGISKLLADLAGESGVTATGSVLGSPSYAAPEQILDSRKVDPRADAWALGVTLYRILAGELPFTGETRMQTYMAVLGSTPVHLGERRPDLPPPMADAIMRCLEKDREARFATVAELASAMEPFAPPGARGSAARVARALAPRSVTLDDEDEAKTVPFAAPTLPDIHDTLVADEPPVFGLMPSAGASTSSSVAPLSSPHPQKTTMRRRWVTAAVVGAVVAAGALVAALRPASGVAASSGSAAPLPVTVDPSVPPPSTGVGGVVTAAPPGASSPPVAPARRTMPAARDVSRRDPRSYR
jgi:serine/threonine-protein kinase